MALSNIQAVRLFNPKGSYKSIPSEEVEKVCISYQQGKTSIDLAKEYNCSSDTIIRLLKTEGVEVRSRSEGRINQNGHTVNLDSFSDTDEEGCAYFYGWLLTDGRITDKDFVSLKVNSKDQEVLDNLKEYMGSSNKVYSKTSKDKRTGQEYSSSSFVFSVDRIVNRLKNLGLSPRKSLQEKVPEVFKFNKHFWRGAIEGDGSIGTGYNHSVKIVGSKELCESFLDFSLKVVPEAKTKIYKDRNMYVAYVRGKESVTKFLDCVYSDCRYKLSRKYNIYKEKYNGSY